MDWEKIFTNHVSDMVLVFKIFLSRWDYLHTKHKFSKYTKKIYSVEIEQNIRIGISWNKKFDVLGKYKIIIVMR